MQEKVLNPKKGMPFLLMALAGYVLAIALVIFAGTKEIWPLFAAGIVYVSIGWIWFLGLKVVGPKEALVLTLFGNYIGTIKEQGFYMVHPFCAAKNPAAGTKLGQSKDVNEHKPSIMVNGQMQSIEFGNKKLSLKDMTLSNSKQKVNDVLGNPIEIGVAVIWRIVDTAAAVFNVDNYKEYLSLQCDSAVRSIVRSYPYDVSPNVDTTGDGKPDDGSLRGSSRIVAEKIMEEIQEKVRKAGIEIVEAKITHLAYAPEIAAVMLQRQQASALIDARMMIVEGAVGMVEMALKRIEEENMVKLDEERKAQMVSNLLVVLCSNKESQPVVNTGSIY